MDEQPKKSPFRCPVRFLSIHEGIVFPHSTFYFRIDPNFALSICWRGSG
jgi:hypothetical protein